MRVLAKKSSQGDGNQGPLHAFWDMLLFSGASLVSDYKERKRFADRVLFRCNKNEIEHMHSWGCALREGVSENKNKFSNKKCQIYVLSYSNF